MASFAATGGVAIGFASCAPRSLLLAAASRPRVAKAPDVRLRETQDGNAASGLALDAVVSSYLRAAASRLHRAYAGAAPRARRHESRFFVFFAYCGTRWLNEAGPGRSPVRVA